MSNESWLTRNWRPIIMITFAFVIVSKYFGWTDDSVSRDFDQWMYATMRNIINTYVALRSGEKVAKIVKGAG